MKLEEIEKLISEATPGPWGYRVLEIDPIRCTVNHDNAYPGALVAADASLPNAALIAAARTLMPKLVAVAKAARNGPCRHAHAKHDCALCSALRDLGEFV